ncbi:MAG: prolipoprotein diacylglyceryl transferase family protein [Nannocystaceae bacterium]
MAAALIPYLDPPRYKLEDLPLLGDLSLEPFGILVGLGVLLGWRWCIHYAKVRDVNDWMARDLLFWALVAAFVMAHWVSVVFYFPERIREDPWVLLYILNGLSSVGGFLGAFLAMIWFLRRKNNEPVLIYGDMIIMGLLLGWSFGRAGCALVHDHPGQIVPEGTWLAVGPWPCKCPDGGGWLSACCSGTDGVFRYDLGLYEFVLTVWLALFAFFVFDWRNAHPGRLTGLVALVYGPARMLLDFMREEVVSGRVSNPDPRYVGLTAAQWATLAITGAGAWLVWGRRALPSDLNYAKESERIAAHRAKSDPPSTSETRRSQARDDDPPANSTP